MFETISTILRDHANPRRKGVIIGLVLSFTPLTMVIALLLAVNAKAGRWVLVGIGIAFLIGCAVFFGRKLFRRSTRFAVERWKRRD